MVVTRKWIPGALGWLLAASTLGATPPGQYRLLLRPEMVTSAPGAVDFAPIVDEQRDLGDPPTGMPVSGWTVRGRREKDPRLTAVVDLGREVPLAKLWIFDTNGKGDLTVEVGRPGAWEQVAAYDGARYRVWADLPLDRRSRYLRITLLSYQANFSEIALDAYSEKAYRELLERRAAEARAAAEREAALRQAREEALRRPLVDLEPYGTLSLVDEVDCAAATPTHGFRDDPTRSSRVETILGRRCRVQPTVAGESSTMVWTLGRRKLLRPGGHYVLTVEYPEDAPRSLIVVNGGNEVSRGFHTGRTVGDALHAKYVSSLVESLTVPLSGRYETWSLVVRLHDRFGSGGLIRGTRRPRDRSPEDGFEVAIAQFSRRDAPLSAGAAVSRIRLLEVVDPERLTLDVRHPPDGLPRRHVFWREEMADGVIGGKRAEERGVSDPVDWYRYKADQMRFLGIRTFAKDLLEFGANQHWDSRPYGGHQWVYYSAEHAHVWEQVVELMGRYGFDVLPYYEYSGSRGQKGLGDERRCRPLTRDDAYTHIEWIERANADITDPDTIADFRKILDCTIVRLRRKARFVGAWIRPRAQLPVGFGPGALERFSKEVREGRSVTRSALREDAALYREYLEWWHRKRRDFLVSVRDHLREGGVEDPLVLFTGQSGEPGVPFADWTPRLVTDSSAAWRELLSREEHRPSSDRTWEILTPEQVAEKDLYLQALLAPARNWGDWEVHHASPADRPDLVKDADGVLFTHAFNRRYTVESARTLDAYRGPGGLAIVRHYCLNEHMMFDAKDQPKLGYFVADVERAGPYCMMAEALAVARGDPTLIGYLTGGSLGRGFPRYVRSFHASFLALPALPSRVVPGAADADGVVVRAIETAEHGTWYALVHTGLEPAESTTVRLPGRGPVRCARTDEVLSEDGVVRTSFHPFELKSWRRAP